MELMVKSDLAITAAGQTIYELLATQTPFIPIKVIENQENNVNGFIVPKNDISALSKKIEI
jgi:spore coat polysaccharide biosynthesis predicted glycosyltransferase SpsG